MKFKHGVIAGFIGGFLVVCAAIAEHDRELKQKFAKRVLDIEHEQYTRGYIEGTSWFRNYHIKHHAGCDRCPH